jgi:hypothetical protein
MVSSIGVRGVPAVDLVQVDVVGAQPAQRGVDGGQDVLHAASSTSLVRRIAYAGTSAAGRLTAAASAGSFRA